MTAAYDLANSLLELAPWDWMNEITLIAVEEPESGRIDHISIMGMAGNHRSLAVYLGPESRQRFNLIQDQQDIPQSDLLALILDTPQLQVSFSGREDLYKSELAAIKQAGKKYRGENWPTFRRFSPGRCPVPADERERQWLCTAIDQVLEIASTLGFSDDTLRYENGRAEILTRRLLNGEWRTLWTPDNSSLYEYPRPVPDEFTLAKVSNHTNTIPIEVAFFMAPNPIGKSRETSVFPYALLLVEPKSRFVLGCELLTVEKTPYRQLIESVPTEFLRLCDRNKVRPSSIATNSPATHALLSTTAAALGVPCHQKSRLPALEHALGSLMGFMGGPGI